MNLAVDASAVIAILLDEPDGEVYMTKLLAATALWMSPINWWEVQVIMRTHHGTAGETKSSAWMERMGIVVVPITLAEAQIAAAASGKYRGRPARLNMGDCFAYALAQSKGIPLLFKGNDFKQTDVRSAFN